jgi:hypothetical protein
MPVLLASPGASLTAQVRISSLQIYGRSHSISANKNVALRLVPREYELLNYKIGKSIRRTVRRGVVVGDSFHTTERDWPGHCGYDLHQYDGQP